ncbi:MAG: ribonuclease Z [Bacteroidetes bacterium]|nr:ribonuclease Z [Bacteroidota bacterium]
MSFFVQFLGTGSALPKENAHPSSQYIFCQNRHFLIDCGEGTQIQLRKYGIKIQKIDAIFISHLHGDHYFGLVGLLSSMHLLGRNKKINIYGPPPLDQIIRSQIEVGGARLDFQIDFHPIDDLFEGLIFEDKVLEVKTFRLKHKIPTHGFIIQEKAKPRHLISDKFKDSGLSIAFIVPFKNSQDVVDETGVIWKYLDFTTASKKSGSYAYCSDTAYSESIIDHIQNVDVLYHEATFTNHYVSRAKTTKHSTAEQAAQIAQLAKAGTLFIGHLSARYDDPKQHILEAQAFFQNVKYAEEGQIFRIC